MIMKISHLSKITNRYVKKIYNGYGINDINKDNIR